MTQMRNVGKGLRSVVWAFTVTAVTCSAQFIDQSGNVDAAISNSEKSEPQAVAIVEKAIAALGGRTAWKQIGGATARVVIAPRDTPARTINWSDDWNKGRVRFRRDSDPSQQESSLIGSDALQVHIKPQGKLEHIQHDNGIAVLAMSYPAPALILSTLKYACTFHLGMPINPRVPVRDDDPDRVALTERCPDPYYPGGVAVLIWSFSKTTGLPKAAELPIWGLTHQVVRSQTITYVVFQSVQGVLVPSQLRIRRVSGAVDQLTISNTAFVQSLADSKFQIGN